MRKFSQRLRKRANNGNGLIEEHKKMPRIAKQSSNANYNVTQVAAYAPAVRNGVVMDNIERATGHFNVRDDTGEILGHVSSRYGIVNNGPFLGKCEETFARHGLTPTDKNTVVTQGGRRMRTVYTFAENTHRIGNDASNDLALQIVAQNSFDCSLSPALMAGFVRMICSNGQFSMEKEISLVGRHTQRFDVNDLLTDDAMKKIMGRISAALAPFQTMARRDISQEQGLNILQGLTRKGLLAERNRERVATVWNDETSDHAEQRTVYGLYQSVTQFLRDQSAERWEKANASGRSILRTLNKISKNDDAVATFATLPATELVKN